MRRRTARVWLAFSTLTLARDVRAQEQAFPSHDVRIEVSVARSGIAAVREEYVLSSRLGPAAFELLIDSCSSVAALSAAVGDRPLAFTVDAHMHAPWMLIHVVDAVSRAGAVCRLSYDVQTTGIEASVPIAVPAATLERADQTRGAHVTLLVSFTDAVDDARVLMPRVARTDAPARWQGDFLAIPSIVRIRMPTADNRSCDRTLTGVTGGLEWRFAVFAATMAIWMSMYLWWFGRRTD